MLQNQVAQLREEVTRHRETEEKLIKEREELFKEFDKQERQLEDYEHQIEDLLCPKDELELQNELNALGLGVQDQQVSKKATSPVQTSDELELEASELELEAVMNGIGQLKREMTQIMLTAGV